ncbi:hypothetical protein HOP51_14640 [Halomonas sp. MCCC 1A11036]|uniref:Purine-cytosine permease n=1 Tax=Billgrantia zhangzhouensis TaxID=2733481 RepID=A0ABS9AI20_9GAMM|nr:cytosine permease [Halomonas zhangzhouensis]MCE8021336.1 hypothetical protein [Halomonas zhangzhouensis]
MDKINSPIPIRQRDANFLPLLWLWASGNVLLASFLVGSYYAFDLGVAGTIWISITANAFAYIICALSCQKSARYGLDEVVALRPTFGMKGASIGGIIIFLITCGWVGILSSMTGSASTMIMSDHLGVAGFSGDYGVYALLIGIVIPLLLIAIKPSVGFKLFSVTAPIMILFTLYMLWRILTTNRVELDGIEQGATLFGASLAIELCFAYAIAWLPYLGAWSRFATSERSAYWASFLGLAVVGTLFAIVGGLATLITGELDPVVWSTQLGLGISSLMIVILGTITSVALLVYSASSAIVSITRNISFRMACLIVAVPSSVLVFSTSLQELFDFIMLFVGLIVGTYWAVAMCDYFLVRHQHIDVTACYDENGPYRYRSGWHPQAFVAMAAGCVVWLFLGGWMSGASWISFTLGETLFSYLTASLPAMLVSAGAYWLLARHQQARVLQASRT